MIANAASPSPAHARGSQRRLQRGIGLAALLLAVVVTSAGTFVEDGVDAPVRYQGQRCVEQTKADLDQPEAAPLARMLVASAENSSLQWERQAAYLEYNVEHDDAENRGYTGGLIGFTSKSGDMYLLVKDYAARKPGAALARYVARLREARGSASKKGLGAEFERAWAEAGRDPEFLAAQLAVSDRYYLQPAVQAAREDGLRRLGQFIYYDAIVMHGPGNKPGDFDGLRARAKARAAAPSQGGEEFDFLWAFLDVREEEMKTQRGWQNTTRISTGQRRLLQERNLDLRPPFEWEVYGDRYRIGVKAFGICFEPAPDSGN